MDKNFQSRRKWYWALILVMGLAEIIIVLANEGILQIYRRRVYRLGLEPDLNLLELSSLLSIASFALPAAIAFCLSRISLIAMQTEPERAKTHKNNAMAYLALMGFLIMFCLLGVGSLVLHILQ